MCYQNCIFLTTTLIFTKIFPSIKNYFKILVLEVYNQLLLAGVVFAGLSIGVGVGLAGYLIHHCQFNPEVGTGCGANRTCATNEHASVM